METPVPVPQTGALGGRRISARRSWPQRLNPADPRHTRKGTPLDLQGNVDDNEAGETEEPEVSGEAILVQEEYQDLQGGNAHTLAAPDGDESDTMAGPYPLYLLLLGAATFIFYTALYLVDFVLIYLTFVPGTFLKDFPVSLRLVIRYNLSTKEPALIELLDDATAFVNSVVPSFWRANMWSTYAASPSFRYVDSFLTLSLLLDLAAFSSAVLLILCMCFVFSAIFLALSTTPPELITGTTVIAFVSVLLLVARATDANRFFSAIPSSCRMQLAMSVYRMRPLDPYHHQIHTYMGIVQLTLLVEMFGHARRAGQHYCRYISYYVGRDLRAGFPERYPQVNATAAG